MWCIYIYIIPQSPKQPILIISFTLCCVIILFSCLTAQIYLTSFFLLKALKQKEKEENQMLSELQRSQTILLTRLAELGAGSQLLPALTALTDQSGPSNSPPTVSPQVVPTAEQTGVEKQVTTNREEEDNMVIDVMHDSEDETSSTTSGSDGGCTSTSHKRSSNYEYH